MEKVSQIDVLQDVKLLIVLADRVLYTCSLDDDHDKRLKKISSNVSFFKTGRVIANGTTKTLVCYVKLNTTSSSIRALEPCSANLSLFMRSTLQLYKDLYIPGEATSIQFFKSSISVGSVKGFQMVDIGSTEVQSKHEVFY